MTASRDRRFGHTTRAVEFVSTTNPLRVVTKPAGAIVEVIPAGAGMWRLAVLEPALTATVPVAAVHLPTPFDL